jgi:hypothetical protein
MATIISYDHKVLRASAKDSPGLVALVQRCTIDGNQAGEMIVSTKNYQDEELDDIYVNTWVEELGLKEISDRLTSDANPKKS